MAFSHATSRDSKPGTIGLGFRVIVGLGLYDYRVIGFWTIVIRL